MAARRGVGEIPFNSNLFVDECGAPMQFYIVPGTTKRQIKPLIEDRSGIVNSKILLGHDQIKLGDPAVNPSPGYVSTKFIFDCVKENTLKDIEKYRMKSGAGPSKSCLLQLVVSSTTKAKPATKRRHRHAKRIPYTPADDKAILEYLKKHACAAYPAGGNVLWKRMERQKVTKHTWSSMQTRYRKHIVKYLQKEEKLSFTRKALSVSQGKAKTRGRRRTEDDDDDDDDDEDDDDDDEDDEDDEDDDDNDDDDVDDDDGKDKLVDDTSSSDVYATPPDRPSPGATTKASPRKRQQEVRQKASTDQSDQDDADDSHNRQGPVATRKESPKKRTRGDRRIASTDQDDTDDSHNRQSPGAVREASPRKRTRRERRIVSTDQSDQDDTDDSHNRQGPVATRKESPKKRTCGERQKALSDENDADDNPNKHSPVATREASPRKRTRRERQKASSDENDADDNHNRQGPVATRRSLRKSGHDQRQKIDQDDGTRIPDTGDELGNISSPATKQKTTPGKQGKQVEQDQNSDDDESHDNRSMPGSTKKVLPKQRESAERQKVPSEPNNDDDDELEDQDTEHSHDDRRSLGSTKNVSPMQRRHAQKVPGDQNSDDDELQNHDTIRRSPGTSRRRSPRKRTHSKSDHDTQDDNTQDNTADTVSSSDSELFSSIASSPSVRNKLASTPKRSPKSLTKTTQTESATTEACTRRLFGGMEDEGSNPSATEEGLSSANCCVVIDDYFNQFKKIEELQCYYKVPKAVAIHAIHVSNGVFPDAEEYLQKGLLRNGSKAWLPAEDEVILSQDKDRLEELYKSRGRAIVLDRRTWLKGV